MNAPRRNIPFHSSGFLGRSILWILASLFLLLVLVQVLLVGGVIWLNTDKGESWLKAQLSSALANTAYKIEFSGLYYIPLTSLTLGTLLISEGDKPLLQGEDIRLRVELLPLMEHTLNISLSADKIGFYKSAEKKDKNEPFSLKPFVLPDMYFTTIEIPNISVKKFVVMEENGKEIVSLSPQLQSEIRLDNQKIFADVSFTHGLPPHDLIPEEVQTKFMFDPAQPLLQVEEFFAETSEYTVQGQGKAALGAEERGVNFSVQGFYADETIGTANIDAQLTGTLDKLSLMATAKGDIQPLKEKGFDVVNVGVQSENILLDVNAARISAHTSYNKEPASLKLDVSKAGEKISVSELVMDSSLAKIWGSAGFSLDTSVLELDLKKIQIDNKNINVKAQSKINLKGPAAENIQGTVSIDKTPLHIAGRVDAKTLGLSVSAKDVPLQDLPLNLPPFQKVTGKLSADIQITGALAQPSVAGDISVRSAAYTHQELGVDLRAITLQAKIKEGFLYLEKFSAQDRENGTLQGSGKMGLDIKNLNGNLSVKVKKLHLLNSDTADGIISADVNLEPVQNGFKLSGVIAPDTVSIQIPERFQGNIPELNVKEKGQNTKEASPLLKSVVLDLVVNAPNQIFVRGWGVDAEFGGKLNIAGTAHTPLFQGSLNSLRGRYEEFGKRFTIKEASLDFAGSVPPYPNLDIVAETKADTIMAQVLIKGPVKTPTISFASEPALPSDEVLARILFGKDMSKITPFQAVQLAQTLRRFSGNGGSPGFDPLGTLRGVTGLDDLRVETDDAGAASLGAGKYLSDKVYLEFEAGAGPGSSNANVQIEVNPNVRIESKIGQDAKGGAGIFWNRDY